MRRVVETILLGLVITSADLILEAWLHKQPISLSTTFSLSQNKDSAKAASQSLPAKTGYVGMTLTKNVIQEVFAESPADKAGVIAGDKIMEVNTKSAFDLSVSGIADELIGPVGSGVEIIVEHGDELRKLRLIRAEAVPSEAERVLSELKCQTLVENWTR